MPQSLIFLLFKVLIWVSAQEDPLIQRRAGSTVADLCQTIRRVHRSRGGGDSAIAVTALCS